MSYIPLASPRLKGKLGFRYTRRFFQKHSLDSIGALQAGYKVDPDHGLDQILLDGLGINPKKVINFIQSQRPSFRRFENFLLKHMARGNRTPEAIEATNRMLEEATLKDATRKSILAAAGMVDDESAPHDKITLIEIDDCNNFERKVLSIKVHKGGSKKKAASQTAPVTDEPIGIHGPLTEATGADSLDGGQALQERADTLPIEGDIVPELEVSGATQQPALTAH